MEAKTGSFARVFGIVCFDFMGFRPLSRRICTTSRALLFENEDSHALGDQDWQLRMGLRDC
eukprot:11175038-Lingulodinium_polyedra.AAC.1